MKLKPIAVIIPEDKFRDEELFEPIEVWNAAEIPFVLASTRKGRVTGDLGGQAEATTLIAELLPENFSAIVVIGGSGGAPHVAQKTDSAIDGRTTRHAGYAVSLRIRKRVEEVFGWAKTVIDSARFIHEL